MKPTVQSLTRYVSTRYIMLTRSTETRAYRRYYTGPESDRRQLRRPTCDYSNVLVLFGQCLGGSQVFSPSGRCYAHLLPVQSVTT